MTAADVAAEPTTVARTPVVYRPESAVFWVFLAALVIGILELLESSAVAVHETLDAQIALSPIWVGFIVFMIWLMLKFDPFRSVRAYAQVLVAGAALGGTTAVVMAMNGNDALSAVWSRVLAPDTVTQWSAALTAPFIEEASKVLCAVVILVLAARVLTRISHALLLGMFVGFGFDVMEDLTYAANEAISSLDSDLSGAGSNLVLRILTAVPAHWAYTSLATVGALLLLPSFAGRAQWPWPRRILVAGTLMFCASLMHFIWDSPTPGWDSGGLPTLMIKFAANFAIFLIPVVLLLRAERRWVTERIDAERAGRLREFDAAVLDSLPTRRTRRQLQRQYRRDGGRQAKKAIGYQQNRALDAIQAG
ncbi:PrsW family intramembrane metalloprotease [Mycolicibacterium komossense]|uniref:PrsW family intramembrane metalloprotease n=1 Tax=Mycolicibacterium komossense TaxID=1779 RepID=UPI0021F324E2|nr:PrsW family intramembrane metalloprotease [Mycolicibacterium komossense]